MTSSTDSSEAAFYAGMSAVSIGAAAALFSAGPVAVCLPAAMATFTTIMAFRSIALEVANRVATRDEENAAKPQQKPQRRRCHVPQGR